MYRPYRSLMWIILVLCMAVPALRAQVQATNGSIQGDVTDTSGSLIPGATVDAREVETDNVYHAHHEQFPGTSAFLRCRPIPIRCG